MKKQSFLIFAAILGVSPCFAMFRKGQMPLRKQLPAVRVECLKARYPLPNALSGSDKIAHIDPARLGIHFKHYGLCWKVSKSIDAHDGAKEHLKAMTKQLASNFAVMVGTGAVTYNNGNGIGDVPLSFAFDATRLSLETTKEALKDYKKTKRNITTAEQELAALVAEQKFQFKVPSDIQ